MTTLLAKYFTSPHVLPSVFCLGSSVKKARNNSIFDWPSWPHTAEASPPFGLSELKNHLEYSRDFVAFGRSCETLTFTRGGNKHARTVFRSNSSPPNIVFFFFFSGLLVSEGSPETKQPTLGGEYLGECFLWFVFLMVFRPKNQTKTRVSVGFCSTQTGNQRSVNSGYCHATGLIVLVQADLEAPF